MVRLTSASGAISFARTFNWTADGVASINSSVSFTMPSGPGAFIVNVIANGIASAPILNLQAGSSNENFALEPDANSNYSDIEATPGGAVLETFYIGAFNGVIMTGDAAGNSFTINDNLLGRSTTINGGNGNDVIDVENNGAAPVLAHGGNGNDSFTISAAGKNLSNVTNTTYVYGDAGTDQVILTDNSNTAANTYAVTSSQVTRSGFGGLNYDSNVETVALTSGTAADTINVISTAAAAPLFLNSGNGNDIVNIGSGNSVAEHPWRSDGQQFAGVFHSQYQ